MKNSSEWLSDIETKLKRRIELRNKRRKAVIRITGGIASCSALLLAIAVIPNVNELSINNKTNSDIISENNENHIPETTNNNETIIINTKDKMLLNEILFITTFIIIIISHLSRIIIN